MPENQTGLPVRHLRIEVFNVMIVELLICRRRIEHINGTDGDIASVVRLRLRDFRTFIKATRNMRKFALQTDDDIRANMTFLCIYKSERRFVTDYWEVDL